MNWVLLGMAGAMLFGFGSAAAQDKAAASKPTREELSERVQGLIGAAGRPYVPTDLEEPAADAPTRFDANHGHLRVLLLDDKVHPSLRDGRSLWALTEPLAYWPSNGREPIIVPRGFVTDLASIPRPLWSWLPPDGPWAKAAVIHDFLYFTQGYGVWKCHDTTLRRRYTREEADWILRDAQRDRNVGVVSRNLVWLGVRSGGQAGWDRSPGINQIGSCKAPPKLPPTVASPQLEP